jgi:hypothetical protein
MFKVFTRLARMVRNLRTILTDGLSLLAAVSRRRTAVAAENLFLRKQLALCKRTVKAVLTRLGYLEFGQALVAETVANVGQEELAL